MANEAAFSNDAVNYAAYIIIISELPAYIIRQFYAALKLSYLEYLILASKDTSFGRHGFDRPCFRKTFLYTSCAQFSSNLFSSKVFRPILLGYVRLGLDENRLDQNELDEK